MSSIGAVLKDEIVRHARKQFRGETEGLKKASSHYRSEIAALKRRVTALERLLAQVTKRLPQPAAQTVESQTIRLPALTPERLKETRERLALSTATLASILQVSPQTIYNWESGKSRPRQEQLAKVAILRKMGKRDVQARVAQMEAVKG